MCRIVRSTPTHICIKQLVSVVPGLDVLLMQNIFPTVVITKTIGLFPSTLNAYLWLVQKGTKYLFYCEIIVVYYVFTCAKKFFENRMAHHRMSPKKWLYRSSSI